MDVPDHCVQLNCRLGVNNAVLGGVILNTTTSLYGFLVGRKELQKATYYPAHYYS